MTSQPVFFDLADTADERFDPIIERILIGLLAFMPFALGAVQPWSELIVILAAAAMLLCLMLKLLVRPDVRIVRSWTYIPLIAFLSLVVLQLVPLPVQLVRVISPNTLALRNELLAAIPGSPPLQWTTLSFYPETTINHLRLLLAVSAIYVVSVNVIRRLAQVKRILAAVAIIGTAAALLALAQNIADATQIYWLIAVDDNDATSGPFVNRSHFAQFMNMSMGAGFGLLLLLLDQLPRHRHHSSSLAAASLARPVTPAICMLACGIVAMAVSVPLSLSRMGMIAMLVAGLFTAIVLATRRGLRHRAWLFAGLAFVVCAAILLIRFDTVVRRTSMIVNAGSMGGRVEVVQGSIAAWKQFPVFGTGLGTFDVIFPMFDPSSIMFVAEHADNEYVQILVENGTVGLLLAVSFIAMIWGAYVRSVGGAPSPMASGALGLGFGFAAILAHSATDFGQRIPANAILTAVAVAILVNLAHATHKQRAVATMPAYGRAARWPRLVGAVATVLVGAVAVFDVAQLARADWHRRAALQIERQLRERQWQADHNDFVRLLQPAMRAASIRPRHAQLAFDLNFYRWKALSRGLNRDIHRPPLNDEDLLDTKRVVDALLAIPRNSPTFAAPYLLAGQLQRNVLGSGGEDLIQTGYRLFPNNPDACLAAAIVDVKSGRSVTGLTKLRRVIELSSAHRVDVIETLVREVDSPDLALQFARSDRAALRQLAQTLKQRNLAPNIAEQAQQRADELLLEEAAKPDAPAATLAEAAYLRLARDELQSAIELFRRAVSIEYGAVNWRLDLARALLISANYQQAIEEARLVLRHSPGNKAAQTLVEDAISKLPRRNDPVSAETPATAPTTSPGFKFD